MAPVASFRQNGFGLHDMTGNVYEWVWDWNRRYDAESSDPIGPESGRYRMVRGGSFFDNPRDARVAYRGIVDPSRRSPGLGLRVARSLP